MKITVDTEVLQREHMSIGDFLVLLIGYYGISYKECLDRLASAGIVQHDLFCKGSMILSDNTKNLVAKILTESDSKVKECNMDFDSIAKHLQQLYPSGVKPGTTYEWQGNAEEIKQKLMLLVTKCDFSFTEAEAVAATKEYVSSFKDDTRHMQLLKYFILKTDSRNDEMSSQFMSIIENNR